MQFNTYIFILLFFPLTVFLYFELNKISQKLGSIMMIVLSLFFYSFLGWYHLAVFLISVCVNLFIIWSMQFLLKNKEYKQSKGCQLKILLWIGVFFNIGLLFYHKYINFFIDNICAITHKTFNSIDVILPIGISFITFQQIAILVDIYHREIDPSFLEYLLYISYFPKILMGPITFPSELIPQFRNNTKRRINCDNIVKGIRMFTIGLFKKVIMAETFASAANWGYQYFGTASSGDLWVALLAYTFQIYFDFSGYSDMAIGVSLCFNIELPINFDSPYKAYSFRDFWKRWHISLTKWFTKYVYIPLGGNRKGTIITIRNTMIVFLISGFWHGANWTFVLWGGIHGICSVLDRLISKWYRCSIVKQMDTLFKYIFKERQNYSCLSI